MMTHVIASPRSQSIRKSRLPVEGDFQSLTIIVSRAKPMPFAASVCGRVSTEGKTNTAEPFTVEEQML